MELTISFIWVQSLIDVVIQVNIEHIVVRCWFRSLVHVWYILMLCIVSCVSCHTDLIFLFSLEHMLQLDAINGPNRLILIYPITHPFDTYMVFFKAFCYSNHSSFKDKWSHNKQSSPVGYQVTNGGLQENSTRSPHCIAPLFI